MAKQKAREGPRSLLSGGPQGHREMDTGSSQQLVRGRAGLQGITSACCEPAFAQAPLVRPRSGGPLCYISLNLGDQLQAGLHLNILEPVAISATPPTPPRRKNILLASLLVFRNHRCHKPPAPSSPRGREPRNVRAHGHSACSEIRLHLQENNRFFFWHFHIDIHSSRHTEQRAQPVLLDASTCLLMQVCHKVKLQLSVFS